MVIGVLWLLWQRWDLIMLAYNLWLTYWHTSGLKLGSTSSLLQRLLHNVGSSLILTVKFTPNLFLLEWQGWPSKTHAKSFSNIFKRFAAKSSNVCSTLSSWMACRNFWTCSLAVKLLLEQSEVWICDKWTPVSSNQTGGHFSHDKFHESLTFLFTWPCIASTNIPIARFQSLLPPLLSMVQYSSRLQINITIIIGALYISAPNGVQLWEYIHVHVCVQALDLWKMRNIYYICSKSQEVLFQDPLVIIQRCLDFEGSVYTIRHRRIQLQ